MNSLITESFVATRQPSGAVWIEARYTHIQHLVMIPKEDCAELARLLMWPVISDSHKVDYSKCVGEPE